MNFKYSFFPTLNTRVPQPFVSQWRYFCEWCEWRAEDFSAHESSKDNLPLWSPTIYREGTTRGNDGVEYITAFVADIDNGLLPENIVPHIAELKETYNFLLHSTFSNTKDHPKWRLIIPFSVPVPKADWADVWERCNVWFMGGNCDPATKDPARMYYLPGHPEAEEQWAFLEYEDGEGGQVYFNPYKDLPDRHFLGCKPLREAPTRVPVKVVYEPLAVGENEKPGDYYNRLCATTPHITTDLLYSACWTCHHEHGNETYVTRPNKKAREGVSGHVFDDGSFQCFTSSDDKIAQGYHTAFYVYACLKCGGDTKEAARQIAKEYNLPTTRSNPLAVLQSMGETTTQRRERMTRAVNLLPSSGDMPNNSAAYHSLFFMIHTLEGLDVHERFADEHDLDITPFLKPDGTFDIVHAQEIAYDWVMRTYGGKN